MSDIKLFRIGTGISELPGESVQIEKSLQSLFEANLETLLGVRFIASEHSTGPIHGGRIDTLDVGPKVRCVGSTLNRCGWSVQVLQMNS